jgi:hypothetical protein
MFSRPKSLNLESSAPNPIVFASFGSSNQTQLQTRRPLSELPRLTLSFTSESGDEMDDDPPEKQKPADMATFGDHRVV